MGWKVISKIEGEVSKGCGRLLFVGVLAALMVFYSAGFNLEGMMPGGAMQIVRDLPEKQPHGNSDSEFHVNIQTHPGSDHNPDSDVIVQDRAGNLVELPPGTANFEEDLVRCSTHVFDDRKKLHDHLNGNAGMQTLCNPTFFRKYFIQNKHFYKDGVWFAPNESSPVGSVFYPDGCSFDESLVTTGNLPLCMKRKGIKKVLFHGDSNGYYYFISLVNFFSARSRLCELIREETGMNPQDMDPYFAVPGLPLVQKFKGCTHCFSKTYRCHLKDASSIEGESTIEIEYIGMLRIMETKLYYPNRKDKNTTFHRDSFLEYLYRDYFPYRGMPDLWIISPPFHHESWQSGLEQHERNMHKFSEIIDRHVPQKTHILLLTDSRECAVLQPRWAFENFMEVSNTTKNEMLHYMNQVLFDALESKLLSPLERVYGFLDMGVISCPFTCRWHFDGAHMVEQWYDRQIEFIFSYFCGE